MSQFNANQGEEIQDPSHPNFDSGEAPVEDSDAGETGFVAEKSSSVRNTGLILLGFLIVGAGAIWFMRFHSGPATAAAATKEQKAAKDTITDFLKDGDQSVKQMQDMLVNTKSIVDQFKKSEQVVQVTVENLQSNPFQFEAAKTDDPNAAKEKETKDRIARLEAEKKGAVEEAGHLQIQSIFCSTRVKNCMINGTLYNEGQEISGFVIEQINPDSVMIRRDSKLDKNTRYKFKVSIKR
jgi:hypothetical protein